MRDAKEKADSIREVPRGLLTSAQRVYLLSRAHIHVYAYTSADGSHWNLWYHGTRLELTHRAGEESEFQRYWREEEGN
jgi:hypothetical protein